MESLAAFVAILLAVLLLSSVIGMFVSWRASTLVTCLVGALLGLPGAVIGTMLLVNVGSTGAKVFGLFGIAGFVLPLYRMYRLPRRVAGA